MSRKKYDSGCKLKESLWSDPVGVRALFTLRGRVIRWVRVGKYRIDNLLRGAKGFSESQLRMLV